jgi:iron complex transport system permease protein
VEAARWPTGKLRRRLLKTVGVGTAGLVFSIVIGANFGHHSVQVWPVLQALPARVGGLFSGGSSPLSGVEYIFWQIRMPRILLGAMVGGALSLAGASLQGLLGNPLADPYLTGVSAGAAFGATLAIVLGLGGLLGGLGASLFGFAGGLLTILLVLKLARIGGKLSPDSFLLTGVVVGSFLWAAVTFMMTRVGGSDLLTVLYRLMGSLGGEATWLTVAVSYAVAGLGGVWLYAHAGDLNALVLGEEAAAQLGSPVERVKLTVVSLSALITAAAVAVSGIIGFVGLVIPHMARRLVGSDHRVLLPAAGLIGAAFLVWADGFARLASEQFPVGVITALLGAPFFCYLFKTRQRGG